MKRANVPVSEPVHAAVRKVASERGMFVHAVVEEALKVGLKSKFGRGVARAHRLASTLSATTRVAA